MKVYISLLLCFFCATNTFAQDFDFIDFPMNMKMVDEVKRLQNMGFNSSESFYGETKYFEKSIPNVSKCQYSFVFLPFSKRIFKYSTCYSFNDDIEIKAYSYYQKLVRKYGEPFIYSGDIVYNPDRIVALDRPKNLQEFLRNFTELDNPCKEVSYSFTTDEGKVTCRMVYQPSAKEDEFYKIIIDTNFEDITLASQLESEKKKVEFFESMPLYLGILVVIILLIFIAKAYSSHQKDKEEKAKTEKEEYYKKRHEERLKLLEEEKIIEEDYNKQFELLKPASDSIYKVYYAKIHNKYDIKRQIIIFVNEKILYLLGKKFNFSDVIKCEIVDTATTQKGTTTAITSTDTGNMLGRSVVGGILMGGAGAVIGGATATKKTVVHQEDDIVEHAYTIKFTVNDIMNPIISLDLGKNKQKAEEIYSTFLVIISSNKQ